MLAGVVIISGPALRAALDAALIAARHARQLIGDEIGDRRAEGFNPPEGKDT